MTDASSSAERPHGIGESMSNRIHSAAVVGAFVALTFGTLTVASGARADGPATMTAHFINVGQGDATLLEFDCGAVLIDAGGEGASSWPAGLTAVGYMSGFFEGRRDLKDGLDALILTHQHVDHIWGAPRVVDEFDVARVIDNGRRARGPATKPYKALIDQIRRLDKEESWRRIGFDEVPKEGLLLSDLNSAFGTCAVKPRFTALWGGLTSSPTGWGANKWGDDPFDNENNHSLVIRVDYGGASMLFTGDLQEEALRDLVRRYGKQKGGLLDVDVYQVGHHGSHNATTPDLMKAMSPKAAVISMGPAWRGGEFTAWDHGHPRKEIVELLESGVSDTREESIVRIFEAQEAPYDKVIMSKAVYATGWDKTVVLDISSKGVITAVRPN